MVNTSKFIQALKATWLRRILFSNDSSWYIRSQIDFRKLVSCGDGYAKQYAYLLETPFGLM